MAHLDSFTRRQRDALAEASRDRLSFAGKLRPVVTLAGKEYRREDLVSCSYEGSDGYAMLLDAATLKKLPWQVEQRPCAVNFETDTSKGTVRLPGFRGHVARRLERGYAALAATGGYEAERTPVGNGPADDVNWRGARFDTGLGMAFDPLRRRYAGSEMPVKERPLLFRKDAERWTWNLYCSEPINWAAEQGEVVIADTPTNARFFYPATPLDRGTPPVWHFERGVDFDGPVGEETPEGERYFRVVVHSQADDSGNVRFLDSRQIDNKGLPVFGGSAYMHALEPETDGDSAATVAAELARRLGRNDVKVSIDLNYPPFFLRRGDVVSAQDKTYEITPDSRGVPRGVLTTHNFLFRVESVTVGVHPFSGSVAGEGMLVGVERTPMDPPAFERTGGFRPLWGQTADLTPYFDLSLPWVRYDQEAGVVYLDEDIAARHGVDLEPIANDFLEVR